MMTTKEWFVLTFVLMWIGLTAQSCNSSIKMKYELYEKRNVKATR